MLGNGAFGNISLHLYFPPGYVFKAYDENHDRYVAIKRSPKVGNKTSREMEVLLSMQGEENVIQLLDFFYSLDTNHRLVQNSVFEFCDQTLEDLIKDFCDKKKSIPIEKVKSYTKQAVNGLANMHRAGIAHRDLKPENILMKGEEVKICDLGSSKFLDTKLWRNTPYVVSRYYRAPELIMASTHYTTSIDIWGKVNSLILFIQANFLYSPWLYSLRVTHKTATIPRRLRRTSDLRAHLHDRLPVRKRARRAQENNRPKSLDASLESREVEGFRPFLPV